MACEQIKSRQQEGNWLHNPSHVEGAYCSIASNKISSSPQFSTLGT